MTKYRLELILTALIVAAFLLASCERDEYNQNGQHRDSPSGNGGIIYTTTN